MPSIADNIKRFREMAGMSQDDLAEAASVNRVTLAKYEAGKSVPGANVLSRLADVLHVSADALLKDGADGMSEEDAEIWNLRETVRRDPERRELFNLARHADIEQVRQAVAIIDALKKTSGGDSNENP